MSRLSTGVDGFDAMVQGGLPIGSSVVLQGPPGQEKLRFALSFLAEGLKAGASGLVVIASQSPESVLAELRNLGVNLDQISRESRLRIVDWYSWSEETVSGIEERGPILRCSIDLTNLGVALSRAITALAGDQPRRAVIELLSPATNIYEVSQVYAFAQSAKKKFDRYGFTSLVLLEKEMHGAADLSTLHQPFDGVIEIERTRSGDRIVRKVGVLHLRDTAPEPSFQVLELTEKGLRVARESRRPTAAVPKGAVLESQEERARRLQLITQIARERLKLNPQDADALFALAAAQATLDDIRGGLQSLERLAELEPNYPGLWVLKTKLHARLGEADRARQSRMRAQQGSLEPASDARMIPCPMCEAPVAADATSCTNCGVRFAPTRTLEDELEELGHAAIQDLVQEELGIGAPTEKPVKPVKPKEAELPTEPEKQAPSKPVPKPALKPSAKKGLTNGLVLKRGVGRKAGVTNGLKGRTNGLRGRTNGLTNGLGRTNGLTNGLGRRNGLTNGLGRTNGITNGLGRTNGITNGLGRTNGLTNGLGGAGRVRGFHGAGLRGAMKSAGWKLYVIPIMTVALLLVPLFFVPEYQGPAYPIRIDGQFEDWANIPRFAASTAAALDANIDIVQVAMTDNIDSLSFLAEVRGTALQGDSQSRVSDVIYVFLDTDRSSASGYRIQGIGADRMIEIAGLGGRVQSASLFEFDVNRDSRDWGGWFKATPVTAASSGGLVEFQASWQVIVQPKAPVAAAFAARNWNGQVDVAETTATSALPHMLVRQDTAAPSIVVGAQTTIARITLEAIGGDVAVSGLNVTLMGTYLSTTFSTVAAVSESQGTISRVDLSGNKAFFRFSPITISPGSPVALRIDPSVATDDGTTVGAFVAEVHDVITSTGGVAFASSVRVAASLGYVGVVPSTPRVDGAFADWSTITADPLGDVTGRGTSDIDLLGYGFQDAGGIVLFYAQTAGVALNGTLLPSSNRAFVGNGSAPPDSDRDGVPDSFDREPYDFNNDGIPDTATGYDYDGDGVKDYGAPGGTDLWLNTTIPADFPPPYAGRAVSVYIGPVERPIARGEDTARFYLDEDGSATTGYAVGGIGADYLVEVTGKEGEILSATALRFSGTNPGSWSWTFLSAASAAKDRSRLEAGLAAVATTNMSGAFVEMTAWAGGQDMAQAQNPLPTPMLTLQAASVGGDGSQAASTPDGVQTLDISGNQKWFFTNGATTGSGCTTNLAASTTAGSSATSTTLSGTQSICWFTPLDQPDSISGVWEVILDAVSVSNGTQSFSPSANGDVNAWTAVGCTEANEYQCVNQNPNDGDTTYIVSNASVVTDSLFNIPDWSSPPSPLTIVRVQVEASCRKTAAASVDVRVILKSGTTTSVGATSRNCANSATYDVWSDTWTTDPADGAAWTLADINALQIGVRDADTQARESRVSHVRAIVTFAPVYSVEIAKCNNEACSSSTALYGPTNSNTFGDDVTFTTGTIGAQTLGATERIVFKITMVAGGSVRIRYNGANPGTDDSRATVPIPEFGDVALPVVAALVIIVFVRRRGSKQSRHDTIRVRGDVPRQ